MGAARACHTSLTAVNKSADSHAMVVAESGLEAGPEECEMNPTPGRPVLPIAAMGQHHRAPCSALPSANEPWPSGLAGTQGVPAAVRYLRTLDALDKHPAQPVSLALTVPFCATRCLCCAREVQAAPTRLAVDAYVDALILESRHLVDRIGLGHEVQQLHIGGGSATELNERQWVRLLGALHGAWHLPGDVDLSVVCDPRRVSGTQIRLLQHLGCAQLSMPLFDLDPQVQQAIGRIHGPALIDDVCELARRAGIECICLELMVGLPMQTLARWQATLTRLLALAPDRIRLARYRHGPVLTATQCGIDAATLPDERLCQALYTMAVQRLGEAGYRQLGQHSFVLDTDAWTLARERGDLWRSALSYTTAPPAPTLGLGAGAHSSLNGLAFRNITPVSAWQQAVETGRLSAIQCWPCAGDEPLALPTDEPLRARA